MREYMETLLHHMGVDGAQNKLDMKMSTCFVSL